MVTLEQACEKAVKFATRGINSIYKINDGYLIFMRKSKDSTALLEFNPIFIEESTGEIGEYYPSDNYSELRQRRQLEIPLKFKADEDGNCEYLKEKTDSKLNNKAVKVDNYDAMRDYYADMLYENEIERKVSDMIEKKQRESKEH